MGNNPGSAEFTTGATTATSKTVSSLPCDGRNLYAALYTHFAGAADWQRPPQVTSYKASTNCASNTAAQISSPAVGAIMPGASATFSWTAGFGAVQYWLDVGNNPGSAEFATGATAATSKTVSGLPCDGRTLYAALYTYFAGAGDWQRPPQVTSYKASTSCSSNTAAQISSPAAGAIMPGASATFSWTAGFGAAQYWLDVGNNPGSAEFATGATAATSKTVNGLPCDGRNLYITLYTRFTGAADWQRPPQVTSYKASTTCSSNTAAQMSSPAAGATLTGSTVTFDWTAGMGAVQYWLDVGNNPGTAEFTTGATAATSRTVGGLPCDGRPLYATLYTHFTGAADWQRPPQVTLYKAPASCSSNAVVQVSSPGVAQF